MSGDDSRGRRRRTLRGLRPTPPLVASAAVAGAPDPTPVPAPAEPSFVCSNCRREMLLSERSRISRAKCRACV